MTKTIYKVNRVALLCAAVATFILTGQNLVAQTAANCEHAPFVKNLMAFRTAPCIVDTTAPHELTKKEVGKLIATAKSADDHLKIAAYYNARANRLDAQGAGYEEAAATYRHGPVVKNLMAPNTAARYEYIAQKFREEAKADRILAESQSGMAKNPVTIATR